ncbi:hypothetical protein HY493_01190 [Candidatus Woesearchaeota archaeon]|nr:hypothetical protein [Candidatus Woesearchaeota archaeon]
MKAQVAMEYLILIGFVMAMLIPLVLLFYSQSADTALQVRSQQVRTIGQEIVEKAETVYYLGEPSRLQFRVFFPESIENVTLTNKALIFKISTAQGLSDIVVPTSVNLTGDLKTSSGLHLVSVQSKGTYVLINST